MYVNERLKNKYCYVCETIWDKAHKKYRTPSKCIGNLDSDNSLIPNRYLSQIFSLESSNHSSLSDYERLVIKTVINKYGEDVRNKAVKTSPKLLSEEGPHRHSGNVSKEPLQKR
jgi:hypothetical protein